MMTSPSALQELYRSLDQHRVRYCVLESTTHVAVLDEDPPLMSKVVRDLREAGWIPAQMLESPAGACSLVFAKLDGAEPSMVTVEVAPASLQSGFGLGRLRRWLRPNGLVVAAYGSDGTGKSTMLAALPGAVGSLFRSHMGFHWRPMIAFASQRKGEASDPHAGVPDGAIRSIARVMAQVVDYQVGYWRVIRPQLCHAGLVTFDRYFDDLLVDPRRYRYGGPEWVLRLARKLVPCPDLTLVLDAPESVALSRKQEISRDELSRQREAYRRIAALTDAIRIDAAQPAAAVASAAAGAITRALASRMESRPPAGLEPILDQNRPALDEAITLLGGDVPAGSESNRVAVLPSPRNPRWIVPLGSRRVLRSSLEIYQPQTAAGRALKLALKSVLEAGAGCIPGAARRLPAQSEISSLLCRVLQVDRVQLALSFGAPGRYRKFSLRVMDAEGGVLAYAKLGLTEAARMRVRAEADVLRQLAASPEVRPFVPRLLHDGEFQGGYLLVESPGRGHSGPQRFNGFHERFLRALSEVQPTHRFAGHIVREASDRWDQVESRFDAETRRHVDTLINRAARSFSAGDVECGLSHGDFAPWNTLIDGHGLFVFDWESSRRAALPGWDRFHFHTQVEALLGKTERPALSGDDRAYYWLYLVESLADAVDECSPIANSVDCRLKRIAEEARN